MNNKGKAHHTNNEEKSFGIFHCFFFRSNEMKCMSEDHLYYIINVFNRNKSNIIKTITTLNDITPFDIK
jgi:hypothetical protein